jgi:hypothetical protein
VRKLCGGNDLGLLGFLMGIGILVFSIFELMPEEGRIRLLGSRSQMVNSQRMKVN